MTGIASIILETPDPDGAERFYRSAFDLGDRLQVRQTDAPTSGFRGFTLSVIVAQPGNVDALVNAATHSGATMLKPAKKSFWGYGGVLQAPDGAIWKIASAAKKDSGPASRQIDDFVLLLGVADVAATKRFYSGHGLAVGKSFGSKYVEFEAGGSAVKLALYTRRAAAKDAGVAAEGTGSHRIAVVGDGASFTDPDGFVWETASVAAAPSVSHAR
jgi:predicted lactoylglutathione lyase